MKDKFQILFHQVFANSSEAIIILDLKGCIVDANPLAEKMLGETIENMAEGDPWRFSDLKTPDGKNSEKAAIAYFKAAMKNGKVKFPWSLIGKENKIFYVDVLITFLQLENEKIFIAQLDDTTDNRQNQKLLKVNKMVLEEIAQGVSLPVILDTICREVEAMVQGSFCTVLTINETKKTLSLAAGPTVSDELAGFFQNLPVGQGFGSCGSAAFSGEKEFVSNTFSDPRWEKIRDVAIQFGIKSCWSMPIIGNEGLPIGTVALSQLEEGSPGEFQEHMLNSVSSLLGLAIQNDYRRNKMLEFGQQFRSIVNALPDLIFIVSKDGDFIQVHGASKNQDLLHIQRDKFIGKNIRDLYSEENIKIFTQAIQSTILKNESQITEYKLRVPAGDVWLEGRTSMIQIADKEDAVMWIARDITQRKLAEETVQHLAYHDVLTGLPNRKMCLDNISMALSYAKRYQLKGALMYIDIDNFKIINDEFGHHVGDLVLKGVAERLDHCLRSEDIVSRFGGDEFLIVISPSVSDKKVLSEKIKIITTKIREKLRTPFLVTEKSIIIECSIGVSYFPDHSENVDELIKKADTAMYYSKSKGKNTMHIYDSQLM